MGLFSKSNERKSKVTLIQDRAGQNEVGQISAAVHAPAAGDNGATPSMQAGSGAPEVPQGHPPDLIRPAAAPSKQLYTASGEILAVLMRTPELRALTLAAAEALVMPAVASGQFLVAEARSNAGTVMPVATAVWASVSLDVDKRLSEDLHKPIELAPSEWRSGDIPWLVLLAGDQRMIQPLLKVLQDTTLKGRSLKMRVHNKEGKTVVGILSLDDAEPPRPAKLHS